MLFRPDQYAACPGTVAQIDVETEEPDRKVDCPIAFSAVPDHLFAEDFRRLERQALPYSRFYIAELLL